MCSVVPPRHAANPEVGLSCETLLSTWRPPITTLARAQTASSSGPQLNLRAGSVDLIELGEALPESQWAGVPEQHQVSRSYAHRAIFLVKGNGSYVKALMAAFCHLHYMTARLQETSP